MIVTTCCEDLLPDEMIGRAVVHWVAKRHDVTVSGIKSESRQKELVAARYHVAHILQKQFNWTMKKIGDYLGRDHSTIVSLLRRARSTDLGPSSPAAQLVRAMSTCLQCDQTAIDIERFNFTCSDVDGNEFAKHKFKEE